MSVVPLELRLRQGLEKIDEVIHMLIKRHMYTDNDKRITVEGEWPLAFQLADQDEATKTIFRNLDLDPKNPFHWRALIEAFTRAYAAPKGRPRKGTVGAKIDLGLDIFEVVLQSPDLARTIVSIAGQLKKKPPYKSKYKNLSLERLRKLVSEVVGATKAIDLDFIEQLKNNHPDEFFEQYLQRGRNSPANLAPKAIVGGR